MIASLVKGTVLGGLVLFIWGAISWMALPWHGASLLTFGNEDAVTQAIVANAPRSGMYLLPNAGAEQKSAHEKMAKGPVVLASVRTGPIGSMTVFMISGLVIQMLGALLGTALLLQTRPLSYGGRVLFLLGIALSAGVLAHLPDWNWWSFSASYTMLAFADLIIGWLLAGLVIAKVAK